MSEQAFQPEHEHEADVLVTPLRRRPRRRRSVYSHPTDILRVLISLFFVASLVTGALYYLYQNNLLANAPYVIELNGKPLAILHSADDARRALLNLRKEYASKSPMVVMFTEGEPKIQPYHGLAQILTPDEATSELKKKLTPIYDGYAIFVDRIPQVIFPTEHDAWQAISLMMERGLGDKKGLPTFKQRITIDHLQQNLAEVKKPALALTPEEAAAELVHPPRKRVYTVDIGDNFWKIATENGITVDDLVALNPGVNYKALRKGDKIKLPDEPSMVTVSVREIATPAPAN